MIWFKKTKKSTGHAAQKPKPAAAQSSEAIRRQALANAAKAREAIGNETLEKIAAAMTRKQQSVTEQARRTIQAGDTNRLRDELGLLLKDKNK